MKAIDKRIAARLLALGELSEAELGRALAEYRGEGPFPSFLARRGFARPEAVCRAEAEVNGFDYFDLRGFEPSEEMLGRLPAQTALSCGVLPVGEDGDTLVLAMGNPSDVLSQDSLRLRLKRPVRMVVAMPEELEERLLQHYGPRPSRSPADDSRGSGTHRVPALAVESALRQAATAGEPLPSESISEAETARFDESSAETLHEMEERRRGTGAYEVGGQGADQRAVSFPNGEHGTTVRRLFEEAMDSRAHEVELQPGDGESRVRHRVRGLWRNAGAYPAGQHQPVVETLLGMAGHESGELSAPLDRQFLVACPGRGEVLATLFVEPAADGPRAVVRLTENVPLIGRPLHGVGLPEEIAEELNGRLAERRGGLLLLTSPDLRALQLIYHSLLRTLARRGGMDVLSLERRAERRMPGVVSVTCPTQDVLLASLANASFMVPDALGIELVENGTVLNRALNVAVQGTTVIATLRAPSSRAAQAAITAAHASSMNIVRGVLGHLHVHAAQRLCQQCCRPIAATETLPAWARALETAFHEAGGCGYCGETGYSGIIYLPEYRVPHLEAADGGFRTLVDQRDQIVSACVAGQIDPRHFPETS